jgi:hypothetical protein
MSVITKKTDPSLSAGSQSAVFTAVTDFIQGDCLDIQVSLRRPARVTNIAVASGGACTVRINSLNRRYPLDTSMNSMGMSAPYLGTCTVWYNTDALSYSLTAGQTLVIDDIPVNSVEIVSLTGSIVVTAF